MTDIQLDAWGIIVGEEIDSAVHRRDEIDLMEHPAQYSYWNGVANGLSQAMSWLNLVERNTRFSKRILDALQKAEEIDRLLP